MLKPKRVFGHKFIFKILISIIFKAINESLKKSRLSLALKKVLRLKNIIFACKKQSQLSFNPFWQRFIKLKNRKKNIKKINVNSIGPKTSLQPQN